MTYGLPLTSKDTIHVSYYASIATILYFTAYLYNPEQNRVKDIPLTNLTTGTSRAEETHTFRIGEEGELIGFDVFTDVALRGQCYILVSVRYSGNRGLGLIKGYVTKTRDLNWTFGASDSEDSTNGRGIPRIITGTDPAAGNEISEAVPTNARWKIKSMIFTLVTDATVSNRRVRVKIDDGSGNDPYAMDCGSNQAASNSYAYAVDTVPLLGGSGFINVPIPDDLPLSAGMLIETDTTNLQAGDNYGAPVFIVEEWIEDA